MKRLRRLAALFAALFLGVLAWLVVMLGWRAEGELRLARELSTGRLIARVPEPKHPFSMIITFGPPNLTARLLRPIKNLSAQLPRGTVREVASRDGEQIWQVNLDPADKTWELEVTERRPVWLPAGRGGVWRVGTKTRVWRTNRVSQPAEEAVSSREE
jgi:hypothetical protein